MKKFVAVILSLAMMMSFVCVAFAGGDTGVSYKITSPYENVKELLSDGNNHYKTNLHTHTTISDASVTLPETVEEYYAQNFDILAITDHGVYGREWDKAPYKYWLMRICTIFNALSDGDDYYKNQYEVLSTEKYNAITNGTYGFDGEQNFTLKSALANGGNRYHISGFSEESNRTYGRGMYCLTQGAELSAASIMQNHLNGFFTDWGQGYAGMLTHEGDYEYFVKNVEKNGGITFINHPGHYLNSKNIEENAKDVNQLFYFSDIFERYNSCLGIETFNNKDNESVNNRVFWDELLQYVIPRSYVANNGKARNVYGFSNSDGHELNKADTEFSDFILKDVNQSNVQSKVRSAMENGEFFATGRLATHKGELDESIITQGPVPRVISLDIDEENDIITVKATNAERIEWVANGDVIYKEVLTQGDVTTSVLKLRDFSDKITCYVRFQIFGKGGYCYSNPFICDNGNMASYVKADNRSKAEIFKDKVDRLFTQGLIGSVVMIIRWAIEKELY